MDPISFGIVPNFKTCFDYFQLFKAAQALDRDCEILLLKLDLENVRFIIWGEKHNLIPTTGGTTFAASGSSETWKLAGKTIDKINSIFQGTEQLEARYGVKICDDDTNTTTQYLLGLKFLSTSTLKRLGTRGQKTLKESIKQFKWAVTDKNKLGGLLIDVRELVDGLYSILPVPDETRDQLVIRDMQALLPDLVPLRFIENASKDTYPTWCGAASGIIAISEAGSIQDGRTISRWIEQTEREATQGFDTGADVQGHNGVDGEAPKVSKFEFPLDAVSYIVFILTQPCVSSIKGITCSADRIPLAGQGVCFVDEFLSLTSLAGRLNDTIGRRIMKKILYKGYTLPLATVNVYCGPCNCAIKTAAKLCTRSTKPEIPFKVRIDHRLPVSCCSNGDLLGRLRKLLRAVEDWELGVTSGKDDVLESYLDRAWLEQRIYELELSEYDNEGMGSARAKTAQLLEDSNGDAESVPIYLAESDTSAWILRTPPFPWTPRMPRRNEIFQFSTAGRPYHLKTTYLGTFTSNKNISPDKTQSTLHQASPSLSSPQIVPVAQPTESEIRLRPVEIPTDDESDVSE